MARWPAPPEKSSWTLQTQNANGLRLCPFLQPAWVLHGHTQDQPGPRRKVPTAVRQIATVMNQVIIHQESGFVPRTCSHPFSACLPVYERTRSVATSAVGTKIVQA